VKAPEGVACKNASFQSLKPVTSVAEVDATVLLPAWLSTRLLFLQLCVTACAIIHTIPIQPIDHITSSVHHCHHHFPPDIATKPSTPLLLDPHELCSRHTNRTHTSHTMSNNKDNSKEEGAGVPPAAKSSWGPFLKVYSSHSPEFSSLGERVRDKGRGERESFFFAKPW